MEHTLPASLALSATTELVLRGVAWNVKILPCKFIGADGSGSIADAIACLDYIASFAARGVKVVASNNSWGGGLYSQALSQAIAAQRQQGILFVAAAGNDGADHDVYNEYPCSFDSPNILCVSAITEFDVQPVFSDFGRHTVHIGAPGFDVLSTLPGNTYGKETGTSMAAPHVAGVAALLKAQDPTRDWRAIRNLILTGGKVRTATSNTISRREVSAFGSLTCSNSPLVTRLQPISNEVPMRALGSPILLSMLNINCASPSGVPTVTVSDGSSVALHDDGLNGDVAANDGIYSALWTPPAAGTYTLTFPNGDVVTTLTDAHLESGFPAQTLSLASSYLGGPVVHTLVGNIDADPDLEILRSGLAVGPLYAWKHDGTPAAGWPRIIFQSTGTYLDISGVAYPVLGHFTSATDHLDVFANYTGLIKAAYDGAGNILPGWPLSTYSEVPGAAADLDGDGLDNIVVENNDDVSKDFIEIHRPDGTSLPGWPITLPPLPAASMTRTPALADLFGDGELEIISTDLDRVYAYHRDGSVVAGFPVDLSATSVRSYPVVGDVDGDGAPEIVVVSQVQDPTHAAFIVILSNTGVIKRTIATSFQLVRDVAPALARPDRRRYTGDRTRLPRRGAGGIGVWRGDGSALPGWPVLINNWSGNTAPVVGDVDGDGSPDIVITTQIPGQMQGDVRAYDHAGGDARGGFPKR